MTMPAIEIGGVAASVQYAGLSAVGEFQFNVVVPASLADGDQPVTATYSGFTTQSGAVLTVQLSGMIQIRFTHPIGAVHRIAQIHLTFEDVLPGG
jgi:hypothetical protein